MIHRGHLPRILLFLAVLTVLLIPTLASPVRQAHAASGPDLTVDSIWLEENSNPGQPVTQVNLGDQFLIVASIKNIGTATASGYYLDVYYDSDYGRGGPDTIAANETQVWYIGPLAAQAGTHTTKWIVDPDNQIVELNENNNEKDYTFTIGAQNTTTTTTTASNSTTILTTQTTQTSTNTTTSTTSTTTTTATSTSTSTASTSATTTSSSTSTTIGGTGSHGTFGANVLDGDAITASASGTLSSVGINVYAAYGHIRGAIYSTYNSTSKKFGGLLGQSGSTTAVTGWNDLSISGSVSITQGTTYYIAFQADSSNLNTYFNNGGTYYHVAYTYNAFPDPSAPLAAGSITDNMRIICTPTTTTTTSSTSTTLSPATVSITLTANPVGSIVVNGTTYTSQQTFTWIPGSLHTISANSPVPGASGTQYVWASWADGGNQSRTITTPSSPTTYTANYQIQYQVTYSQTGCSLPVSLPATEWVNAGGSAVGVFPSTVTSSDGKTQCLLQNASPPGPVNAPAALAATYKTQYYLTVTSSHGNQTGQGWYDAGSNATFAVTSPASGGAGTQYAFTGWASSDTGGYAGADASHSLTVSSPITETASWKTQWQVAFAVNPSGDGSIAVNGQPSATAWYDDGAVINVQASHNTGYAFSSWSGDVASITFANSTSSSTTVTIHGTGTVTARFALADTTPPVITPTVTPNANSNGWNNGPVTVTWSVSDPESGIASSNGCATTTLNNETSLAGTTLTCTVTNGAGLPNSASVTAKIDLTAPTLKLPSPTAKATGPSGATVTYDASASDLLSGVNAFSCTPASGSIFPLGNSTVSCSVKDKAGNAATGTFTVTVQDKTAPVVTVPASITVNATGPNGAVVTYTASASDLVDGPLSPTCTPSSGSTFALGSTTVTCSVTDKAGNTASASFQVAVSDKTPPTLQLPSDMTVQGTGSSGAVATFSVSASDLVDGSVPVTCTPASGSMFPFGTNRVSCSATDKAGNTATGSFAVTVQDKTPPVLTLPANMTVDATGSTGAVVAFTASALDAVDGSVSVACAPASGSIFPLGTTTVSCSATDKAGNAATGTFTVIVQDKTPPVVTVPADITLDATGPGGAAVTFNVSALDAVDGAIVPTCSPASGSTFAVGSTVVSCSATDKAGNAGSASFKVTVSDRSPPTLNLPSAMTVNSTSPNGEVVTYSASASDLVDGSVPVTCTPASGSTFPLGATTVSCSATDKAGNTATGTFAVTVQDKTPPVVTVPADMTVDATGPSGAVVTFTVSALDSVDGSVPVTCTPASGSTFPVGSTVVSCSATDKSGNTGSASFKVTVLDKIPPTLNLPSAMTVEGTSSNGAVVTYSASASDLVDGSLPVTCTPASGSTFLFGTTTVSCSATDKAGNSAAGTFTVTVQDKTPPVVTVPADMTLDATGPAGAIATFTASAVDNVDGSLAPNCSPASGSTFALGSTTVTCSVTDKAGNAASASFKVTVADRTPPTLTLPSDMTVQGTGSSGAVATFSVSASDLVDGSVPVTCAPASGSTFPFGTNTVSCSATDKAGNTGTGTFAVTVQDKTPPVLTVPADMTVEATGPNGAVVTFTVSAMDAVDGSLTPACTPSSGSVFVLGSTKVTCSASDKAGNTASGSFTVTVVDRTPPTLTLPSDMTVQATSTSGAVVKFTASASDLVDGSVPFTCTPASGSTFPAGTTKVTCSATDKAGNSASGSFKVTVPAVTVKLLSSSGNGLSGGVVQYQYNSGGWKPFGTTGSGGIVSMALPPGTYVFQISYASGSQQVSQNVAKNSTVTFQTVRVHSDSGKCIGFIQVELVPTRYTGASWQPFTQDMELLPGTYMFHFSDKTNDKSYTLVVGAVKHIH